MPSTVSPLSIPSNLMKLRPILAALLALTLPLPAADAPKQPVLLYCRHFNAVGETRYLPDGTFKEILTKLRGEFEVRVNSDPLTAKSLAGVNVLLIANPSDKAVGQNPPPPHVSAQDVATLGKFVEQGGGLIVLGNQENHNLEFTDLNQLLARFGLQFVEKFTDMKAVVVPKNTPVIGGLNWAYYAGNQVVLTPGHAAKPRALVSNDVSVQPLNGARNEPGCLLAVAEPGRGRVVVATDAGWITDDALSGKGVGRVSIKPQDNWEIMRRLTRWAAGR
ncbi:MAG: hypothetical protein FD161_3471 [Limisphaerales bacterium]|nr:MAG: hypothetical protein FD161_3471 [Limisphaerales bacterium]KAG0507689.1 MAG: hypothetical protein E1N63_3137 [Limisphaerales bacterium]TXT52439.1 MAG: hypothetical protein FD140_663 [Limisphaerales bacterium]